MENASKALLMAAGILIGVIILSWAVYIYTMYASTAGEIQDQIELGQIQSFNNRFLAYDGQTSLTVYDINTVINMANDNNKKYEVTNEDDNYYIAVYLENNQINDKPQYQKAISNLDDYLVEEDPNVPKGATKILKKYKADVEINSNTNLVKKNYLY